MGIVYSALPVLNVVYTYGFETAYFRFSNKEVDKEKIYATSVISIFVSSIVLSGLLWTIQAWLAASAGLAGFEGFVRYGIFISAIDALSAIPFARLRQEGKPKRFAMIKLTGILANIFLTWFFLSFCANRLDRDPESYLRLIYDRGTSPVNYILLANLAQSILTLTMLLPEFAKVRIDFDAALWGRMMRYSAPLLIVGLGGIVNETFDRLMLGHWLPGPQEYREGQVGIYNACYKLSILISLSVQAFRMGAEPFFFKQSVSEVDPRRTYARVMKFFVLTLGTMFLAVSLYLPLWKYFIGPSYRVGLVVVPILLMANIFLGIYYNLSVWYKLGNKTIYGTLITLIGTVITFLINYFFIPFHSYVASAWATFFCYGGMMVLCYRWGQKHYKIPYAKNKLIAFMVVSVLLFFLHKGLCWLSSNMLYQLFTATVLIGAYMYLIFIVEKKELRRFFPSLR